MPEVGRGAGRTHRERRASWRRRPGPGRRSSASARTWRTAHGKAGRTVAAHPNRRRKRAALSRRDFAHSLPRTAIGTRLAEIEDWSVEGTTVEIHSNCTRFFPLFSHSPRNMWGGGRAAPQGVRYVPKAGAKHAAAQHAGAPPAAAGTPPIVPAAAAARGHGGRAANVAALQPDDPTTLSPGLRIVHDFITTEEEEELLKVPCRSAHPRPLSARCRRSTTWRGTRT